jgi:hypothetical protein
MRAAAAGRTSVVALLLAAADERARDQVSARKTSLNCLPADIRCHCRSLLMMLRLHLVLSFKLHARRSRGL